MNADLALIAGAAVGLAIGALSVPVTRRELAGAIARSSGGATETGPTVGNWHRPALVGVSGLVAAVVMSRSGWSIRTLPPLLLLMGLIQLAYCDLTRLLLPKAMAHATTVAVALSVVLAAGVTGDWHRAGVSLLGGVGLFALLLSFNLLNPAWMAFGDVRLAPAVGLGLAWISPMALLEGFFLANLLTAVIGLGLMAIRRGDRKTALPFGLYLAVASVVIVIAWS